MNCQKLREDMMEWMAGEPPAEAQAHLGQCAGCARELDEMRRTLALLDQWQAPEPTPYFYPRLQATLREERAAAPQGWFAWMRRPALGLAMAGLLAVGITSYNSARFDTKPEVRTAQSQTVQARPGTAVADLQDLDRNFDIYAHCWMMGTGRT
jgi:hypothetical protein